VTIVLLPSSPKPGQERLLETRARCFPESAEAEVALQLRRRWAIFAHGVGLIAEIALHEANRLGLTPKQAEAAYLLADGRKQDAAALDAGVSFKSFRDRLDQIKTKTGRLATVIALEIRAQALGLGGQPQSPSTTFSPSKSTPPASTPTSTALPTSRSAPPPATVYHWPYRGVGSTPL
jgi:hypothetical protein